MAGAATRTSIDALIDQIGAGVPDATQYQRLTTLHLEILEARQLAASDPFSAAYRDAAFALYLSIRGRTEQGYEAVRDEPPATPLPEQLWSGLVPWSFRDTGVVSEHLLAWSRIFRHMTLEPGGAVLEYGPGSGQILLMLARLGYRSCGVDIDPVALQAITLQAAHLGLPVETEQGAFGDGFAGERFDVILFYEAFHHALDFEELLIRLHARLKPGGRVVLCGEPIVGVPTAAIPYPWGPRLDALSVFCIRRFGWMELGFTHDYFAAVTRATGWRMRHDIAACGRASTYVLEPDGAPRDHAAALSAGSETWRRNAATRRTRQMLRSTRKTVRAWRLARQ
ncbi:class I SAM-dependent methyltransferase [Lichenicola sp.]|uniref:class I SAM-dependent methyltransferase n=1 Tax=Lichenicola sp. TaxID=2804529 RepID=UPI003AFFE1AA